MEVNPLLQGFRCEPTEDPEGFWMHAAERIPWFRKWDRVFDWSPRASAGGLTVSFARERGRKMHHPRLRLAIKGVWASIGVGGDLWGGIAKGLI